MRQVLSIIACLIFSTAALGQSAPPDRIKALQGDPVALKLAQDAGKKASFFCANCHGEAGISNTPDVPNLAGQQPAYLLDQIRKFGSGERKDPFMQGMIKVLKEEERLQIALFYAASPTRPAVADPVLTERGKQLFDKLCTRCHGTQAHGNELYPRLASQKILYLQKSITHYRDKTGVRSHSLMSIATAGLKSDEVIALANYLAQLP